MRAIEDSFHAIQITPGMWIVPNEADITEFEAVNIVLPPGAAFGSGERLPLPAHADCAPSMLASRLLCMSLSCQPQCIPASASACRNAHQSASAGAGPVDAAATMMCQACACPAGEHPTTRLCLQWLDGQQLQGMSVLDYGTGTGILGIAALLKGDQLRQYCLLDVVLPEALQANRWLLEALTSYVWLSHILLGRAMSSHLVSQCGGGSNQSDAGEGGRQVLPECWVQTWTQSL